MLEKDASNKWDTASGRTRLGLRQVLDHINDRILELHQQLAVLSVQIAQIRADLDHLRSARAERQLESADELRRAV